MKLTVQIERREDGCYRASLVEIPGIFYINDSEKAVRERMDNLVYALRSPHIQVDRILPDGDVVLCLTREGSSDEEESAEGMVSVAPTQMHPVMWG